MNSSFYKLLFKDKRVALLLSSFLFASVLVFSQNNKEPYRSAANTYYWKNRKPHEAYWQQDVQYRIRARMNDNSNVLSGNMELTYFNNSPDTLNEVYFHLYQNAFLPGSYYAQMAESNGYNLTFGKYQKNGLGTQVESIFVNGLPHEGVVDNTIMKINLLKPLSPGDSAFFKMRFTTYFNDDAGWGRMRCYKRWGFKHYNGAHWYPRMSVYDAEFGWTADQHLVHEFYGDFGTYDVELDFPDNYILEATGMLTNESLMLPPDLRSKIALSNFADKPFDSPPSVIIPYDSTKRKVWKYHAINVHDFAFVSSPTYRIGMVMKNGVRCVAIAHEPHASKWQTAPDVVADIIDIFSKKIGPYAYPKMVSADAFSGMEYPMLTMNSDHAPDYAYIFSHEIGHNWFFGMVGSNETYRAMLDEGFTQYLTVVALEALQKKYPIESTTENKYLKKHLETRTLRDRYVFKRYLNHAVTTDGATLNTHSDMFGGTSPYGEDYRQAYYKSASMLFNLQYVLGEDLFNKGMKAYFEKWKFCHPYDEDMRHAFISATGVDLNWFFDQFIETTKVIDYRVKSLSSDTAKYTYNITFERKGNMQMPIDFTVIDRKDSLLHFYIPNTRFVKETTAQVLPQWYGWLQLNDTYTAHVYSPNGVKNVIIDTTHRLADVYAPDNSLKRQRTYGFDYMIFQPSDLHNYEIYYRPDVWWSGLEGVKAGVNINGNYMNHHHVFDLYAWYNTGLALTAKNAKPSLFSYSLDYNTPLGRYNKKSRLYVSALNSENVNRYLLKATYNLSPSGSEVYAGVKSLFMLPGSDNSSLIYKGDWSNDSTLNLNNTLFIGWRHEYNQTKRNGTLNVEATGSFVASPYDFSKLWAGMINNEKLGLLTLRTRIAAQWATGRLMPAESMLYFAGANPESMIESKFTRSLGMVPEVWGGFGPNSNHFHAGGGLNIRGYAGYLIAGYDADSLVIPLYKGHSGLSFNAELEFGNLFDIKKPKLSSCLNFVPYFFADAGVISVNAIDDPLKLSHIRASMGVGMALTVKKWAYFNKIKPFTIRLDMPLFLNRPPAIDGNYVKFRWLLGIKRAF